MPFAAHATQSITRQASHLRLCRGIRPPYLSQRAKYTFCDAQNADKLDASKLVEVQRQSSQPNKGYDQPVRSQSERLHGDRLGVAVSSVAGESPPLGFPCDPLCIKELDLTMMDDAHWHRLRVLTNCVILGASMRIPAAQAELPKVVFMDAEIGNLVIRIVCTRNESGTYVPKSYFEGKWAYSASGEADDMTPVSPYCTIEGEAFCRLSNVDLAAVAEDMLRYDEPRQLAIVNDAMLSIVSAYDSSRDATLLKLAGDIATGLRQKLPDDTLALINTMQVRQRDGSLDEDDRELLHLGIESGSYSQMELTAAYTVLGNGRMAKRHFQRMAPRDQEEFEKYPIATLYEQLQQ